MPKSYSRLLSEATLILCAGLFVGCANAVETDSDGRLYRPSENALAEVRMAVSRAADNDRRALVVLGANWCHDSRALASRLHQAPLSELIQQHYELVFVDIGFYELDRNTMQQLGVAHYYATPTVLVVDPSNGEPINNNDRHIWGNAYNIDMSTSVQYFDTWAAKVSVASSSKESAEPLKLFAEIDQFEQQLAERLVGGYATVGPMLRATVGGNRPEDFDASWDELRDFRMAIPKAIRELRQEAQRRASAGERDIQLVFPDYPLMSWEKE